MTEAPVTPVVDEEDEVFDLAKQRIVRREATGAKPVRLRFPSQVEGEPARVFDLPDELPLDVFGPLEEIDLDVALLLRLALDAREGREGAAADATAIVIDMLVANPALPKEVLAAIRDMAKRLLTPDAYDALVASRPSAQDLGDIAKYLFDRYGVNLPEASGSSESSDGAGETSKQTSNASTDSTPGTSSETPAPVTSSEPAA